MKVTKAVIPAAGLGTRMLPATKTVPKEMLPIVDKPAIQYIIEEAVASGITDILVVTNRAKSAMDDYFDYHPELTERLERDGKYAYANEVRRTADLANIFYVRQKETRGLGHAVWRAKSFAGSEPFAVLLGDDIMRSQRPVLRQLLDACEKYDASGVCVQNVPDEKISSYASLKTEELEPGVRRVFNIIEKPKPEDKLSNLAAVGRYVFKPTVFEVLENLEPGYGGEIQLTDGMRRLCLEEIMVAVEFEGRRYDTGNITGFLEATIDLALEDPSIRGWLMDFIRGKVQQK